MGKANVARDRRREEKAFRRTDQAHFYANSAQTAYKIAESRVETELQNNNSIAEIKKHAEDAAQAAHKAQNALDGIPEHQDRLEQHKWIKEALKCAESSSEKAWNILNPTLL